MAIRRGQRKLRRNRAPVSRKMRIPRGLRTPVPTRMNVKLTYCQQNTLTPPGAGGCDINVFSANGLYDPDISGVGHQPRGFDQLMALYDHYVVYRAVCTVQYVPTASTEGAVNFIRLKDQTGEDQDIINNIECSYSKYKVYKQGCGIVPVISLTANVGKFLGRSNILSDPQLKGDTSNNPDEQCYFHVGTCGADNATAGVAHDILTTIQYYAYLIEPKNPSQS